jgi:hypothetical protein
MTGWWATGLGVAFVAGIATAAIAMLFGKRWPVHVRNTVGGFTFLLLIGPFVAFLFSADRVIGVVVYQEGAAAVGAILLALTVLVDVRRGFLRRDGSEVEGRARAMWVLGALGALVYGLWAVRTFVLDAFAPRQRLVGVIEAIEPGSVSMSKGGPSLHLAKVEVQGRWFFATRDIEPRLQVGAMIDAEVGAGSQYILSLKQP